MTERYLLDTHALVWWAFGSDRLPPLSRECIENPENIIFFSPVSAMEIATKVRIGKFEDARPLVTNFAGQMLERGLTELPLKAVHGELAGCFPSANNDPWDRLLAAQARIEGVGLISNDSRMDDFGIRLCWGGGAVR